MRPTLHTYYYLYTFIIFYCKMVTVNLFNNIMQLHMLCIYWTACADRNCPTGSQCKVDELTGQSYCEPSCLIDNGGCPSGQICSLRNVTCVTAPCPPVVDCSKFIIKCMCACDQNHESMHISHTYVTGSEKTRLSGIFYILRNTTFKYSSH